MKKPETQLQLPAMTTAKRGGARVGAGRKKGEETKVIRIKSKFEKQIKDFIKTLESKESAKENAAVEKGKTADLVEEFKQEMADLIKKFKRENEQHMKIYEAQDQEYEQQMAELKKRQEEESQKSIEKVLAITQTNK